VTLIEHTAYPRLKRTLTPRELDQIYTPTPAELFLAHRSAKGPVATLGFLVHLKIFQRLGYAVATSEIPTSDYRLHRRLCADPAFISRSDGLR
jgi:hypothetical protein